MAECLYIVVPCFNEEEVLLETTIRLNGKLMRMVTLYIERNLLMRRLFILFIMKRFVLVIVLVILLLVA
mgnify:CR=1 FL=1